MAIYEANTVRERTRRETIDELLVRAGALARENNQAALRLRAILLHAPPEEGQKPERPSRVGWLGEIADALELEIEYLENIATALEEISQQIASPTPTPIAPRR